MLYLGYNSSKCPPKPLVDKLVSGTHGQFIGALFFFRGGLWWGGGGGVEGGAQYFQSAASVGPQITLNFATQCVQPECAITALFTNMRILKFKSQLTIAFLAAVNHLIGPLRKLNFTLTDSKGRGL